MGGPLKGSLCFGKEGTYAHYSLDTSFFDHVGPYLKVGQGVEGEDNCGDDDEHDGYYGNNLQAKQN